MKNDADLAADLDRLSGRQYSEEGIPMFLACENLAPNGKSDEPTALKQDLAVAFRQEVDDWQRIHPDAPVTDVAKIVEVLADRDFAGKPL
jgi:hypothetical protein